MFAFAGGWGMILAGPNGELVRPWTARNTARCDVIGIRRAGISRPRNWVPSNRRYDRRNHRPGNGRRTAYRGCRCDHSDAPFRTIFLLSLIPGLAAPLAFLLMVKETRRQPKPWMNFLKSVRELPSAYRRMLMAVGLFGSGDFSPALLILAAATLLRPKYGAVHAAQIGAHCFTLSAISSTAAASYPIGWLADAAENRHCSPLVISAARATPGLAALMFSAGSSSLPLLAAIFVVAGDLRRGAGHAGKSNPARHDRSGNARHGLRIAGGS